MKLRDLKGRLVAALARIVPDVSLQDVLVFGGIAAAGYGIGMIFPPAAWIFCGIMAFWLGIR